MISNVQNRHHLVTTENYDFYTIDGMDSVHSEMLRLLKIIDKIASDNNIPYWVSAGSLIGVVRHNGFIPWDDDLDIELLKCDYLRLITCLTDYCSVHDDAYLFYPEPQMFHCCNYFASRKYFLRSQGTATVYPVKVDIKPYNCIKQSKENIEENSKYKDIANYIIFRITRGIVSKKELSKVKAASFFDMYNHEYGFYDQTKTDTVLMPPYFEYSIGFDIKYENIFPLQKHKFENIFVNIPKDYDYILNRIYGDYMKLPQLHHRVPFSCKMYYKDIPDKLFELYCTKLYKAGNINKLFRMFFLLRFHGLLNYVKFKFIEQSIAIVSNYEKVRNKW